MRDTRSIIFKLESGPLVSQTQKPQLMLVKYLDTSWGRNRKRKRHDVNKNKTFRAKVY